MDGKPADGLDLATVSGARPGTVRRVPRRLYWLMGAVLLGEAVERSPEAVAILDGSPVLTGSIVAVVAGIVVFSWGRRLVPWLRLPLRHGVPDARWVSRRARLLAPGLHRQGRTILTRRLPSPLPRAIIVVSTRGLHVVLGRRARRLDIPFASIGRLDVLSGSDVEAIAVEVEDRWTVVLAVPDPRGAVDVLRRLGAVRASTGHLPGERRRDDEL